MAVRRTPRALHTLVRVDGAAVTLQIPGASSPVSLSAVWLLDHARESRHAATRQREFLASSREDVPRIVDARVADGALHVVWSGAPEMAACTTTHTLAHLDALEHGAPARAPASWSAGVFARGDAPLSTASEMLADDGLGRALAKLRAFGMLRIDAMPSSVQATREIAMRIGPPRETYYGGMWSTRAAPGDTAGVNDTAYLDVAIRPHTDGTYFHDPPGLQVLNCVSQAERGGETLVVDAVGVLDALRAAAPATIAFFAQTRLPWYSYDADTRSGLPFRFNEYDRGCLPPGEWYERTFLPHWRRLVEAINSAEHVERIRLAPGQCLVVDNQRVLHGRTAFAGGVREMVGCYIGRDEYESRLRAFGILEMQG